MVNCILIEFENCENAYKSKNSKKNLKKYIKKIIKNQENDKFLDILNNHLSDIRKYFNTPLQINFKIKEDTLIIFAKKLSDRDINKIKLKNKLKNINNKQKILEEKKEANNKFKEEKKKLHNDKRIEPNMIQLYYSVRYDMPDKDIPNPIQILDNIDEYKKLFQNYLDNSNKKIDLERYILLKNSYCNYMSYMTQIIVNIPNDLETRYKTNNMKF